MKHKRVWTDEQRKAAGERMAKARAARKLDVNSGAIDPEVQAVIDSMTPERRAKLEMIKSQQIARLNQTKEGQEALARHEAERAGTEPPSRIGSREVSLIVRTDGTMVSQYGPCLCGRAKREWHNLCVTEGQHG